MRFFRKEGDIVSPVTIRYLHERIDALEDELDALLKHLELDIIDVPRQKKVVGKA